jgi:hypothetical protein
MGENEGLKHNSVIDLPCFTLFYKGSSIQWILFYFFQGKSCGETLGTSLHFVDGS